MRFRIGIEGLVESYADFIKGIHLITFLAIMTNKKGHHKKIWYP